VNDRFPTPKMPVVDRVSYLLERAKNKNVLHLGCTDWPLTEGKIKNNALLHAKLGSVAANLVGVDYDQEGVNYLVSHGYLETYQDNVEKFENTRIREKKYDLIIAGEIIEHLENPGLFLRAVQTLMNPETELLITTVNAYCLFRFVRYILGKEMVHEDHNYYYSPRVLERLITRCGLHVVDFRYYGIGHEIQHLIPKHFLLLDSFSKMFFPSASDGVIFSTKSP